MADGSILNTLKLKNQGGWRAYYKSANRPQDVPADLRKVYGKERKGYDGCLAPGLLRLKTEKYMSFVEAYIRNKKSVRMEKVL